MKFPKGTRFNQWCLFEEVQRGNRRHVIRRWAYLPDGTKKLERLPTAKYKQFQGDIRALEDFVIRLNERVPEAERTKAAVAIKHAFISPALLEQYKAFLLAQIPTERNALCEYQYLINYFLGFFINKESMPDPLEWHKHHKSKWAEYLLNNPEVPASDKTKRTIVRSANRFMAWLHSQLPDEVPPLKFEPISRAVYKSVAANRELAGETHKPKFVDEEHWAIIRVKAPAELLPMAELAYRYGLRRSETLGVQKDDIKKGYLQLERQIITITETGPLKGRLSRRVPHWFSTPKETYALISQIKIIHPDTLSDLWFDLMRQLKLDYTFHDLRHTFITRAIRLHTAREVQLAAGHRNIETTMRYLHDDRKLDDEVFDPNEAA